MKVNLHTSHPSAFISSTFVDLQDERGSVADTLRENGLNVNALDIKPASTDTSKNEILRGIRESDFVILLIGDRFGSIVPKITDSSSLSVTWWEYKKAIAFGKPVIAYFQNNMYFDSSNHDDKTDKLYTRNRKLFERFKSIVTEKHTPAYFTDSYDLSDKIQRSLISTYRAGVVTMNRKNTALMNDVARLETENETLKRKLNSATSDNSNPILGGLLGGFGDLKK